MKKQFQAVALVLLAIIGNSCSAQDFGCYSASSPSSSFGLNSFSGYSSKMGLTNLELPSGIKDGAFVRHYPTPPKGMLIVKDSGKVVNGKKTGLWLEFNKNGKWLHVGNYKQGKRHGTWKSIWITKGDSLLTETYDYFEGKLHGQVKKFFKGDLWRVCHFKDGLLEGTCIDYNDLDRSKVEMISTYSKGVIVGLKVEFNDNGDTSYVMNYEDGKLHGETRGYEENGQYIIRATYKADSLDGLYEMYHKNGKLFWSILFKDDLPYTAIEAFDSTGNILDMGSLKFGTGILNSYYEDGALKSTATYKDQLLNGEFSMFFEDGTIHEKGVIYSFSKTNLGIAPYRLWIDDLNLYTAKKQSFGKGTDYLIYGESGKVTGRISAIQNIDSTEFIKRKFYYTESGQVSEKSVTFRRGTIGKYELFYKNGQIKLVGNYKQKFRTKELTTFKDGLFLSYHDNGKLQSKINYRLGQEIDSSMFYDEDGILVRKKVIHKNGSVLNVFRGDTINMTDEDRLKQGKWCSFPSKYDFAECTIEPSFVSYYKDNSPVGKWISYSTNGDTLETYEWVDSSFAICTKYYYADFPLAIGYVDKEYNECGNWKIFDHKSGKLETEGQMVFGRKQGKWRIYKRNGKVKRVVEFELGEEI